MIIPSKHIIILARSARMLAESARRCGLIPIVIDQFGDQETLAAAEQYFHTPEFSVSAISSLLDTLAPKSRPVLVYGSGVERNLELLQYLHQRCQVWGNTPESVQAVRDPHAFFGLLQRLDIRFPQTYFDSEEMSGGNWLVKQVNTEGGFGVSRYAQAQQPISPAPCYYQECLQGQSIAVLFLANAQEAEVIGYHSQMTLQLSADLPFVFHGLTTAAQLTADQQHIIGDWITALVNECGLRGLNTLDCIIQGDDIFVLELNPRLGASMAVYEQQYPAGLLHEHIQSFTSGAWSIPLAETSVHGFMHVLATQTLDFSQQTISWPDWVVDRPYLQQRIAIAQPVCTVTASELSVDLLKQLLLERYGIINALIGQEALVSEA